jgi:hypothetical protein
MSRWVLARDAVRLAPAHRRERRAQLDQRPEPEADLQERGEPEREPEQPERRSQGQDEAADVVLDLEGGAGDPDDVAAVLPEIDVALDDAQVALVGTHR